MLLLFNYTYIGDELLRPQCYIPVSLILYLTVKTSLSHTNTHIPVSLILYLYLHLVTACNKQWLLREVKFPLNKVLLVHWTQRHGGVESRGLTHRSFTLELRGMQTPLNRRALRGVPGPEGSTHRSTEDTFHLLPSVWWGGAERQPDWKPVSVGCEPGSKAPDPARDSSSFFFLLRRDFTVPIVIWMLFCPLESDFFRC